MKNKISVFITALIITAAVTACGANPAAENTAETVAMVSEVTEALTEETTETVLEETTVPETSAVTAAVEETTVPETTVTEVTVTEKTVNYDDFPDFSTYRTCDECGKSYDWLEVLPSEYCDDDTTDKLNEDIDEMCKRGYYLFIRSEHECGKPSNAHPARETMYIPDEMYYRYGLNVWGVDAVSSGNYVVYDPETLDEINICKDFFEDGWADAAEYPDNVKINMNTVKSASLVLTSSDTDSILVSLYTVGAELQVKVPAELVKEKYRTGPEPEYDEYDYGYYYDDYYYDWY